MKKKYLGRLLIVLTDEGLRVDDQYLPIIVTDGWWWLWWWGMVVQKKFSDLVVTD